MIDIHCHILPGVDDGSATLDESLTIARQAVADGLKAMVATPHVGNGVYRTSALRIRQEVESLNAALQSANIPLTVYPGAEVQLAPRLTDKLRLDEVCSINNSRYVLIELPPTFLPDTAKAEFFSLRMNGYIPILAHPERHPQLKNNFGYLEELVQMGTRCQLTAQSLTGEFGMASQVMSEKMIENDMAHIIATDTHSSKWRKPVLSSALNRAAKLLDNRVEAFQMVSGRPQAILDDCDFAIEIPGFRKQHTPVEKPRSAKRSFFRSMFSTAN